MRTHGSSSNLPKFTSLGIVALKIEIQVYSAIFPYFQLVNERLSIKGKLMLKRNH